MQSCCRIVLFGNGTELANGLWTQLQNGQLLQLCTKDERPVKGLVHVIRMVFISFTYSDSLHADRCLTWAMVERALFFFWRRRWQISTPTRTRQAADLSLRCSIADNWQQMISEDVLAEDKLPQSCDIERQNASKCIKLPVCARMCEVPCRNGHSQSKRGKSSHDWWSFAWNPFLNMLHMLLEVTKHLIWSEHFSLCSCCILRIVPLHLEAANRETILIFVKGEPCPREQCQGHGYVEDKNFSPAGTSTCFMMLCKRLL